MLGIPLPTAQDLLAIAFLVFLEGVLSIDNALVLALQVRPLPPPLRKRALSYGLAGAIAFRIAAIASAAWLLRWHGVKVAGAAYLIYLAISHLWRGEKEKAVNAKPRSFWATVAVVELTDALFAIDSILAAVALTKTLWVIMVGGLLGMIAMRFVANVFVRLLDRYPRLEATSYILVLLIGAKLLLEGGVELGFLSDIDFQNAHAPAFWAFWAMLLAILMAGFWRPRAHKPTRRHRH